MIDKKNRAPLIIFDGNCQGQHLAAILTASGIADAYFLGGDLGFLPSHLGQPCRYVSEDEVPALIASARDASRRVYQATQSTPMSDGTEKSYTAIVDKIIRFPHLQCYALSPDEGSARFASKVDPSRMYRIDLDIIAKCQARSNTDVDFHGFIQQNGSTRPLFYTALHPSGELVALLFQCIVKQIEDVIPSVANDTEVYLRTHEGINTFTVHPVSEDILSSLGFEWGENYRLFSTLLKEGARKDWKAILSKNEIYEEHFSNDTQYWLTLTQALHNDGTKAQATMAVDQLLRRTPGNLHFWLLAYHVYNKYSDNIGIQSLQHSASVFFAGQRIFSQLMAFFSIYKGDYESAEKFGRDYYYRTPDRADALVPLLKALVGLGRTEEANEILRFARANAKGSRLAEIEANITSIPELEIQQS